MKVYGVKKDAYPDNDPLMTVVPPEYVSDIHYTYMPSYIIQFLPSNYGLSYLPAKYDINRYNLYWEEMKCKKISMVQRSKGFISYRNNMVLGLFEDIKY